MSPHIYGKLIIDKGAKATPCWKDNILSFLCCMMGYTYAKNPNPNQGRAKPETFTTYTLYTKINLLWIIDLNVRARASQLLEDNRQNLHDPGIHKDFLDFLDIKNMTHKRKRTD